MLFRSVMTPLNSLSSILSTSKGLLNSINESSDLSQAMESIYLLTCDLNELVEIKFIGKDKVGIIYDKLQTMVENTINNVKYMISKLRMSVDSNLVNDAEVKLYELEDSLLNKLIKGKVIQKGMVPKVKNMIDALSDGVSKAHIIDGRIKNAIILEMFTDSGIGTEILL